MTLGLRLARLPLQFAISLFLQALMQFPLFPSAGRLTPKRQTWKCLTRKLYVITISAGCCVGATRTSPSRAGKVTILIPQSTPMCPTEGFSETRPPASQVDGAQAIEALLDRLVVAAAGPWNHNGKSILANPWVQEARAYGGMDSHIPWVFGC